MLLGGSFWRGADLISESLRRNYGNLVANPLICLEIERQFLMKDQIQRCLLQGAFQKGRIRKGLLQKIHTG